MTIGQRYGSQPGNRSRQVTDLAVHGNFNPFNACSLIRGGHNLVPVKQALPGGWPLRSYTSSSSSALAACKSGVPNPSVNQP